MPCLKMFCIWEKMCEKRKKEANKVKKWEKKVEVQSQKWNVKKGSCERITWLNTIKHGLVLSQLIGCLAGNKKKNVTLPSD